MLWSSGDLLSHLSYSVALHVMASPSLWTCQTQQVVLLAINSCRQLHCLKLQRACHGNNICQWSLWVLLVCKLNYATLWPGLTWVVWGRRLYWSAAGLVIVGNGRLPEIAWAVTGCGCREAEGLGEKAKEKNCCVLWECNLKVLVLRRPITERMTL